MNIIEDIFKGGAEGILSGVRGVIAQFKADPLELAKLEVAVKQAELDLDTKVAAAEAQMVSAINASMQAEAKSEHWIQYSWRPHGAYVFYALVVNNYIFYPYLARFGVVRIEVPSELWIAFTALLGVAAYVRGRDKSPNGKNGS